MARPTVDLQKQKEARQKKLLIMLAPVLLGLLVWQGPKTFKALTGGPAEDPAAVTAPVAPVPGAPVPGATTPATPAGTLGDTDLPLEPLDGQLISFSRFGGVDPFRSDGRVTPGAETDTGGSQASAGSAVLEVNGLDETVTVGGSFPSSDPTFVLGAVSENGIEISLISGSFSDGVTTQSVNVGETVTLVAQPDETEYEVRVVSVAPPAA